MSENGSSLPTRYTSCYRHLVDDKRRVQIPSKWRPKEEGVEYALILWPHLGQQDACLLVLPPRAYEDFYKRVTEQPFGDPKAEALRRILGEKCESVQLDKAGRICIPEWMAKAAQIGPEATMNGMFDRFQIWNPERYEATRSGVEALAPDALKNI